MTIEYAVPAMETVTDARFELLKRLVWDVYMQQEHSLELIKSMYEPFEWPEDVHTNFFCAGAVVCTALRNVEALDNYLVPLYTWSEAYYSHMLGIEGKMYCDETLPEQLGPL